MNQGFNNPAVWANKVAKRARRLGGAPTHTRSIFSGDPVEIDESAGAALTNPALTSAVPVSGLATEDMSDAQVTQRAEEWASLSPSQRMEATVLPALVVGNALMVISPNTKPIPADNVNYNFNRCLTDYASRGYSVQSTAPTAIPGESAAGMASVVINDKNLYDSKQLPADEWYRYKTVPAFKFTLTASILRSRPGGQYNFWVDGTTVGGIKVEGTDKVYTFQRLDYTTAVVGLYIPFIIIATRTVAALLQYGNLTGPAQGADPNPPVPYDENADVSFTVTASGLAEDEALIVEIPGYTTAMTSLFCNLYGLSAGRYVK